MSAKDLLLWRSEMSAKYLLSDAKTPYIIIVGGVLHEQG